MATTDVRRRPHSTQEMLAVHRVFRREATLIPRLVQAVPDGNTAQATLIAEAFRDYQLGLHIHHTGEDTFVWPLCWPGWTWTRKWCCGWNQSMKRSPAPWKR
jgi:Hemerythrin HHE cation binding domain